MSSPPALALTPSKSVLFAWRRRQLRKLAVLLDMEDGVESLLGLAADTEQLRDSLADVDLSLDDEGQEGGERDAEQTPSPPPQQKEEEHVVRRSSSSSSQSAAAAASALMSPGGSASVPPGTVRSSGSLKIASAWRTSWEKDAGSEDTTEVCVCARRFVGANLCASENASLGAALDPPTPHTLHTLLVVLRLPLVSPVPLEMPWSFKCCFCFR